VLKLMVQPVRLQYSAVLSKTGPVSCATGTSVLQGMHSGTGVSQGMHYGTGRVVLPIKHDTCGHLHSNDILSG
jgi:hypothetical protein